MEVKKRGRRLGSKNYTREFREKVVAEASDPTRSIAEVARAHGLNANLIAQWRRKQDETRMRSECGSPSPFAGLLPVEIVGDLETTPTKTSEARATVVSSSCEMEIEVGDRRIRVCGLSADAVCRLLLECLA